MSKFKLFAAFVVLGALFVGCGPKAEPKNPDPPAEEAEMVTEVKRYWQLQSQDPAVDASERLHCWYTHISRSADGAMMSTAEIKTSGQCDWTALATQAGEPGKAFPDVNAKALDTVIDGVAFEGGGGDKWDCARIEVTTNTRSFTTLDCNLADREGAGFASATDGSKSSTAEEAAFRINQLLFMK